MEKVALVFMSPECLEKYTLEQDFLNGQCAKMIVIKILSYFIMTISLVVKVPQLLKVYNARSGEGITYISLFIETTGFMAHFSYCIASKYPFNLYGDAIVNFLLVLTILFLRFYYDGRQSLAWVVVVSEIAVATVLVSGLLSLQFLTYFSRFGMSIMMFGGLSQIATNFRTKSTGQISLATMTMGFTMVSLRTLIVLQESKDKGLAFGTGLACIVIGTIIFQIKLYEKPKATKLD